MKSYSTSQSPSKVWLPEDADASTVFEFMVNRFPRIEKEIWHQRFVEGKVQELNGAQIALHTSYVGGRHIVYFREVPSEVKIPFEEKILYQNENFLIVDKPHFLPIHPSGKYVNETLISRLRMNTGNSDLIAAHRLDRLTAGLVLCILNKDVRGEFQKLFNEREIHKTYQAVGSVPEDDKNSWHLKNCLVPFKENFRMIVGEGEPNSESRISIIETQGDRALFELKPTTGKKHQLRVHMAHIGSGIENDPLYPFIQEERDDDYSKPLKLLAQKLQFIDPIDGSQREFISEQKLEF